MAQLHHGVLAGLGPSVKLSVCNKLQCETEESVGKVSVLLSNTDIHASIRGMEGANQETSFGVNNTIIQPDL